MAQNIVVEAENPLGCQREASSVRFDVYSANAVHCSTKCESDPDLAETDNRSIELGEVNDYRKDNFPINGKVLYTPTDNGIIIPNCLGSCVGEDELQSSNSKQDGETNEMCVKNSADKESEIDTSSVESDRTDISVLSDSFSAMKLKASSFTSDEVIEGIKYVVYESELQMSDIMRLITKDLSEPYSIYTYRYFIHNWPKLCFLAMDGERCVGAIVCKLDMHKKMVRRGYIAMLAIDSEYRRRKIGSNLVLKAIRAMILDDCDEVVLETEITNKPALKLYENLGFVRDKRLFRYYLNGVDALRLKLWLR